MNEKTILILLFAILLLLTFNFIFLVVFLLRQQKNMAEIQKMINDYNQQSNNYITNCINTLGNSLLQSAQLNYQNQNDNFDNFSHSIKNGIETMAKYLLQNQKQYSDNQIAHLNSISSTLSASNLMQEQKLESIRQSTESSLNNLRNENNQQLEQIRHTVDEKLQETLENTLSQSFKTVAQQLEQVHKGLGEMQTLASGVGDLKKVLSNVKNRGILGEIQLGAILKDILASSQYDENVATIPNSKERVEYAIKLPNEDNSFIYLPIDSKFPADTYLALQQAIENGEKDEIDTTRKALITTMKKEAKDIQSKYVQSPYTTDFAIMFLPTEGLYSEACNLGMMETLQKEFKITIAGPSTMAALLNSLQMGFKTLAIQQRSSEVWNLLGSVKSEFSKFENVLQSAQTRIQQTSDELDKLVGARTRAINKQLQNIQSNNISIENYDMITNNKEEI